MSLSKDDLLRYIRSELNIDTPLDGDTELFSTGMLDSVAMVGLISFVEQKAELRVQPGDVTLENFDTVDAILAYVQTLD
ncbi:phosphopantetheine-binding protein [Paracoccus sp. P2]|uniref:Acyl carrier protein n=1 Tax=Paracoccus pantotrophus TaxID=82367 RepID=A0A1I5G2Z9_PARPN|nr:acyl carrier protein [Paracoccus pantotrophus]MDF3854283.1 acyl carrier protein [Paracoccus pantotrophus]QFG35453.1 acyl carrier protein [Paracoccus pantotrophus]QLH13694.1 acyl carrier protein [Paracoccus pantotrophus]RDE00928.1 acyl carrier protein [Paracoccus pantotrophus]RKS44326.1 phosphopantetheine binding protein [Paracoccus pantotrophus]